MKKIYNMILALCFIFPAQILSQEVGDYGSKGTGNWGSDGSNWIVCTTPGTWDGATDPAPSAPNETVNVWIRSGHTVTLDASAKRALNLNVENGAVLMTGVNAPTSSIRYIRVYGTITNNGTIGNTTDDLDVLSFEAYGNLTIQGNGVTKICRIRPGSSQSNLTITIDTDMRLTYIGSSGSGGAGFYSSNSSNDNITFIVNEGRTIDCVDKCNINTASSTDNNGAANTTFIINGTLNMGEGGNVGFGVTADKTCNVTVNGTWNIGGKVSALASSAGTINFTVNSGGSVKVASGGSGTCDMSNAITTISGTFDLFEASTSTRSIGTAEVTNGGKLRFKDGVFPSGTVTLSPGSTVEYYGTDAITLPAAPSTYENLLVTNTAGLSLSDNVSVNGELSLQGGNIVTDTYALTIGSAGSVNRTGGHIVGSLKRGIPLGAAAANFEIGDLTNYTPVLVEFGNVTGIGELLALTTPGNHPDIANSGLDEGKKVNRYYTLTNNGVTFDNYSATFNFVTDDVDAGANTSNFVVKKYDSPNWTSPSSVNQTASSIKATGLTSFSDFVIGEAAAVVITSNGTGGGAWNSASTWQGGGVPPDNADVVILGSDSVYVTAATSCESITVQAGGKLNLTASSAAMTAGSLTLGANSFFYNSSSSSSLVGSGANYNLDNSSTVVHIGSGTVGTGNNLTFGNLVIQRSSGVTAGGSLVINGDLSINNNAVGTTFRGTNAALGTQTHTVFGNVYVNTGTLSAIDVGGPAIICTWNIAGNVYIGSTSRFGPFSSANADGIGIFNIEGDLIIDGGRLQAGSSSTAGPGTGIINLSGNLTILSGLIATNSTGSLAINFVGSSPQTVTMGIDINFGTTFVDTIKAGSSVIFNNGGFLWGSSVGGDFVVDGSLEMSDSSAVTGAGNFSLNDGAVLKIGSADGISSSEITGNIKVTGSRTFSSQAIYHYVGNLPQITGDGLPAAAKNLTINKSAESVTLSSDVTITEGLSVLSGDLDLNGKTITLAGGAMLTETAGNTVKGTTGKIVTTANINAPASLNAAGLGAMITSSANFGSTVIERTHAAASGNSNEGIFRVFKITPANNSSLNASLRFYYDASELNGIAESDLRMFRSELGTDGTWFFAGGTVNAADNYVELSGILDFSYWTLGSVSAQIPVELVSFAAVPTNENVLLKWKTATETSNYGFDVERRLFDDTKTSQWVKLGFVPGNGTTTEPKEYSFIDYSILAGVYEYRIKQIDYSGDFSYSEIVKVEVNNIPVNFALHQNFPNPFNPSTTIKFEIPQAVKVNISVFNSIGQKVATIIDRNLEAGRYTETFDASGLPSGTFIYRMTAGVSTIIKKMLLLK
jgi:hypothetical protein